MIDQELRVKQQLQLDNSQVFDPLWTQAPGFGEEVGGEEPEQPEQDQEQEPPAGIAATQLLMPTRAASMRFLGHCRACVLVLLSVCLLYDCIGTQFSSLCREMFLGLCLSLRTKKCSVSLDNSLLSEDEKAHFCVYQQCASRSQSHPCLGEPVHKI
jgi:hypothetical protein